MKHKEERTMPQSMISHPPWLGCLPNTGGKWWEWTLSLSLSFVSGSHLETLAKQRMDDVWACSSAINYALGVLKWETLFIGKSWC